MLIHCPACGTDFPLAAALQDDAARELVGLLASDPALFTATINYLGLFKPAKSRLSWGRALDLTKSALELEPNRAQLAAAMIKTAEAIRAKGGKQLKNHNYLKQVLTDLAPTGSATVAPSWSGAPSCTRQEASAASLPSQFNQQPQSKTAAAVQSLNDLR